VLPEVDKAFEEFAATEHLPGLVYGVVVDGELIHHHELGFADLEQRIRTTPHTAFRIASMSKSFLCLAACRLRDEGRLEFDSPVGRYLPEFRKVRPPTADSAPITVRNLMTMTTGLPEDNPWGDRQMAISKRDLRRFVEAGLSFSNPPGEQYEYSNLGFVLLGQVISKAAGMPFQRYITTHLLRPLGMMETRWEYAEVPRGSLAVGYRWEHEAWTPEPILHDGEGAACGGLITTLEDFARYMRFHMQAWPARDDADPGPVRRGSIREMHRPFVLSRAPFPDTLLDGATPNPGVSFYGYGLGWTVDNRRMVTLAHTGGLPGYGSHFRFLPDYGVGVYAFANRTYAPAARICSQAVQILVEKGGLKARTPVASPVLERRAREVAQMIQHWESGLTGQITAENFFLDKSREDWVALSREVLSRAGNLVSVEPVVPDNQLRGTFRMTGDRGAVQVHFTLTPERTPKVQELGLTFIPLP
jgi:CubicO group peptidase (beta-lactamase class C family)